MLRGEASSGKIPYLLQGALPWSADFDHENYSFIFWADLGSHVVVFIAQYSNLGFR